MSDRPDRTQEQAALNAIKTAEPEDLDGLTTRLRSWLRTVDGDQPVAYASRRLGVSPLLIAQAVGNGYLLYMIGDTSNADTAMVGEDGE